MKRTLPTLRPLGHRPGLDMLRGVAILMVLSRHAGVPFLEQAGGVGVVMFFTLSGFLITALMIDERNATGAIRLRSFYRRRGLRLIPGLLVMAAVVLLAGGAGATFALALTFAGNWPAAAGYDLGAMTHVWSLAVEEQFYLLWPLVLATLMARREIVITLATVLIVVSLAERAMLQASGAYLFYASELYLAPLLIGALLAFVRPSLPAWLAVPALAGLVAITLAPEAAFLRWWISLVPFLTALAIASMMKVRGGGPLVATGRISYGLYLWNWPIAVWLTPLLPPLVAGIAIVATTFATAAISYRYVERPFLRKKEALNRAIETGQVLSPTHGTSQPVHQSGS